MEHNIVITIIFVGMLACLNCNVSGSDLDYNFLFTDNGIIFTALRNKTYIATGSLYYGKSTANIVCKTPTSCSIDGATFNYESLDDGIKITWETDNIETEFGDCFDLGIGNWYGGPQRSIQIYPLEGMQIDGKDPYVLRKADNFGVAERYWLSSYGFYIIVAENSPLFIEQNVNNSGTVCFKARASSPYLNRKKNVLEYTIMFKNDAKEAHLDAVNNHLGKPTGTPRKEMITEPIWTTWAKYKRDINDEIVIGFAEEIRKQGYVNGQIEIDDQWETCYGSQQFSNEKFPDIKNTVAKLKELHFRVTLWVHPFVNRDCEDVFNEGVKNDYFVKDVNGGTNASWWNGNDANVIDFTKPEAAEWYSARLRKLQNEVGIDSFKFDAGETDYLYNTAVYQNVDNDLVPNIWNQHYIRTCAEFGDLVEVRSTFGNQDLPIFVRMLDKDSSWGEYNGLYTLITTLFQLNFNGYTMVLPDMIGGNGYSVQPDAELLVRWTQANAFMPAMQFSYLPWEITSNEFDAAAIVKKFVDLHISQISYILDAMQMSVSYGWPVNPPVWWVDPTDAVALGWDDEYMVGDAVLVAPVIKQGARSRDVYLPKGKWIDGNNGTVYEGGHVLYDFPAPIDVLPYFYRVK